MFRKLSESPSRTRPQKAHQHLFPRLLFLPPKLFEDSRQPTLIHYILSQDGKILLSLTLLH